MVYLDHCHELAHCIVGVPCVFLLLLESFSVSFTEPFAVFLSCDKTQKLKKQKAAFEQLT